MSALQLLCHNNIITGISCSDIPLLPYHLWILNRLLVPEPNVPKDVSLNRLLKYVVSTCHPKMNRRWMNETLSVPYYASLQSIPSDSITFRDCPVDPKKLDKQIQNDLLLLASINNATARLDLKVPELARLAAVYAQDGTQLRIYAKETCREFHELLCALLKGFATSLQALGENQPKPAQPRADSEFKKHLGSVLSYGCLLRWIVNGYAIDHYLQNLENMGLLTDHRREVVLELDESGECDPDLGQPTAILNDRDRPLSYWKSYKDWLKLTLSYFIAAEIVVNYVTGKLFCQRC